MVGWLKGRYCCGAEGQWGDRVNKKSEGKGCAREREEVRLVRAQTWAKDAGGDTHLHVEDSERGSKDEDRVCRRIRECTQNRRS